MLKKSPFIILCSGLLLSLANTGRAALVEEFLLNEGATNPAVTTVFSIASTNTGTLLGSILPIWETNNLPPIPGGATAYLNFDATVTVGTYVLTTSSAVTGANARTVALWLMAPPGAQPQNACICSWGANTTAERFTLRLDPGTSGGTLAGATPGRPGGFCHRKDAADRREMASHCGGLSRKWVTRQLHFLCGRQ